jgi:hypothetical protein
MHGFVGASFVVVASNFVEVEIHQLIIIPT